MSDDVERMELLTKTDARELLKISQPTLDRLISRGELPVVRVGARAIRILRESIELFIRQRTETRSQ